jgi:tripartite-type tricarboxylate transporter receptor subunit TctC
LEAHHETAAPSIFATGRERCRAARRSAHGLGDVLNDFAAISPLVTAPVVLFARKTMPAKDLSELMGWLKENPRVSMGVGAVNLRLLSAFFQRATGT